MVVKKSPANAGSTPGLEDPKYCRATRHVSATREATAVKSPCTRTKEQPQLIAAGESQAQQQRPSAA